jgi:hypothetical protein
MAILMSYIVLERIGHNLPSPPRTAA